MTNRDYYIDPHEHTWKLLSITTLDGGNVWACTCGATKKELSSYPAGSRVVAIYPAVYPVMGRLESLARIGA